MMYLMYSSFQMGESWHFRLINLLYYYFREMIFRIRLWIQLTLTAVMLCIAHNAKAEWELEENPIPTVMSTTDIIKMATIPVPVIVFCLVEYDNL